MPNQKYGIKFPFTQSSEGFFLGLNSNPDAEVRSNLMHLIMTQKGSRYFLPDFGTNLMRFLFEPLDSGTISSIDKEIRKSVAKYIPNLVINNIEIKNMDEVRGEDTLLIGEDNSFSFAGEKEQEYTVRIRIDYSIGSSVFETKDFVIINL
jgi:phage baseplate assembly protein W